MRVSRLMKSYRNMGVTLRSPFVSLVRNTGIRNPGVSSYGVALTLHPLGVCDT